jgi:ankyrin repeat protein
MMNCIKFIALLVVLIHTSLANAGAYEDFFLAAQRDDAATITSLFQRGFDPNSRNPDGQVGLTIAARAQAGHALDALLAHPSLDVDAANAAGETALMLVALKGDLGWCQRLIERGAAVQREGWSPLHYAATSPNVKVVELLLARGAAVDAVSPNGSTALMMAARYGSEETVNLLLARGADAARRNERQLRAADFARQGGREALAARLARP